tara:strand:- start:1203 stop:1409 length:207 start_codon:yes stop_codon:yes gene_type:complete
MKILSLHGWHSVVGGVKPTFLRDACHNVINPHSTMTISQLALSKRSTTSIKPMLLLAPDVVVQSPRTS